MRKLRPVSHFHGHHSDSYFRADVLDAAKGIEADQSRHTALYPQRPCLNTPHSHLSRPSISGRHTSKAWILYDRSNRISDADAATAKANDAHRPHKYVQLQVGQAILPVPSGKPLVYFSLLFCTFSYFFQKKQKKYQKAQSTFFGLFQGGQKSRPLFKKYLKSKSTCY